MIEQTTEEKDSTGVIALGAGVALCVLAVVLFFAFRVPQGIVVARGQACVNGAHGAFEVAERCTEPVELKRRNDLITPTPGTKLDEVDGGVRLQRGKATFAVWKRQGGDAMQVRVSHGFIEVVGTRFTVEQTETDGSVKLDEGEIAFHWLDGHTTRMAAGESLSWGAKAFAEPTAAPAVLAPAPTTDAVPPPDPLAALVPAPAPTPESPAAPSATAPAPGPPAAPAATVPASGPPAAPAATVPASGPPAAPAATATAGVPPASAPTPTPPVAAPEPAPTKPSKLSMDDVLWELSNLRNQRKYKEAVSLLRPNAERSDFSMSQKARLSYEMGLLLQDRLRDKDAACRHWRWHAERFPENGERAQRVNSAIKACDTASGAPSPDPAPSEESPTPPPQVSPEAPQEAHD